MCGIAFAYHKNGIQPDVIEKMTAAISHRGPDAQKTSIVSKAALGHARLSIIDLDPRSDQPMSNATGDLHLVFNGEIYNYRELKKELVDYPYKTQSDTEVILAAYLKWGFDCVHHFNGMFAFALYDEKNDLVFMARDRFGIKPLFIAETEDGFYAASEAKAFLPFIPFSPNKAYLSEFLLTGARLSGSDTCFKNVRQLNTGELFIYKNGAGQYRRFYHIGEKIRNNAFETINIKSPDEFLEEHLTRSLSLRTRADVPISISYSGGLDSSIFLAIIGSHLGHLDVLPQTLVSSEVPQEEVEYAQRVAQSCGYQTEFILSDDLPFVSRIDYETMMWHTEAPFKGSHYIDRALARSSRQKGRIVILDGNGADEHLLGYYAHLNSAMGELFARGNYLHLLKLLFNNPWDINRKAFWNDALSSVKNRLSKIKGDYLCSGWPIEETQAFFFEDKLQSLLWFRDRSSMAYGTELRVPFLDHELTEAMLGLSLSERINHKGQKYILRQLAKRMLPAEALLKKKNSFLKPELPYSFKRAFKAGEAAYAQDIQTDAQEYAEHLGPLNALDESLLQRLGQVELWYRVFGNIKSPATRDRRTDVI